MNSAPDVIQELGVRHFRWVLLLKTFFVLWPSRARKYYYFKNLTSWHVRNITKFAFLSFFKGILRLRYEPREAVAVFSIWSNGYHHFLAEALPKLIFHEKLIKEKLLLVPADAPAFITYCLTELGFTNTLTLANHCLFRSLHLIENPHSGHYTYSTLMLVKNRFVREHPVLRKRVYISRKSARSRKVVNEQAVTARLLALGFEVVETERLSFSEQVELFASAEKLISIHGAGLTNMLFMPPDATVIELMPATNSDTPAAGINHCFERMAHILQLNYHMAFCAKEDERQPLDTCNIRVDINALEELLRL